MKADQETYKTEDLSDQTSLAKGLQCNKRRPHVYDRATEPVVADSTRELAYIAVPNMLGNGCRNPYCNLKNRHLGTLKLYVPNEPTTPGHPNEAL